MAVLRRMAECTVRISLLYKLDVLIYWGPEKEMLYKSPQLTSYSNVEIAGILNSPAQCEP